jgi:hypothetical protein
MLALWRNAEREEKEKEVIVDVMGIFAVHRQ